MKTPLAKYNILENKVNYDQTDSIVWAGVLDKRFKIEVVRTDGYKANISIYDSEHNDIEIHTEQVGLAYGAMFGPDVEDVAQWQNLACKVVDSM